VTKIGPDWQQLDGDSPLSPWEHLPGIAIDDERQAVRAVDNGDLTLYRAPDSSEVASHNAAAYREWQAQRKAARTNRVVVEVGDDRKRVYAVGALEKAANKLSTAHKGVREATINHESLKLGKYVNSGHLTAEEVVQRIIPAAYDCGWAQDDCGSDDFKVRAKIERPLADQTEVPDWDEKFGITFEAPMLGQQWTPPTTERSDDTAPVYADRLLKRSDLRSLPEPEPLIDNVLDQGTLVYLYGKWGTLKSFIGLDWGLCVSTGKPWQGRKVAQRRVLYVVGEGAYGFKGRVQAWETAWQTAVGDDGFHILPLAVNLSNPVEVGNLCALVTLGGYGMVIIDTLSRCMVGADENSAKDCGQVVDAMTRILACTPDARGVVLGVHHAGKDAKTFRGSSVFEAAADTVYFTARDDDTMAVNLIRQKRKDGPELDAHELAFDGVDGTGSGVLKRSHGQSQALGTDSPTAKLSSIWSQHFGTTGATGARLRQIAVDDGSMAKTSFYRALSELVKSGFLVNTGTDKRPFYMSKDQRP